MTNEESMQQVLERLRKQVEEFNIERTQHAQAQQRMTTRYDWEVQARREAQELLSQIPQNAKEYLHPILAVPESPIVLHNVSFEVKTSFTTEIRRYSFEGKGSECPMAHITTYIDLCDTIADGVNLEYVRLKSFRWSLAGKALHW